MKDGDSIIISLTSESTIAAGEPAIIGCTLDRVPERYMIEMNAISMPEYDASNFALIELYVAQEPRLVHGGPPIHLDAVVGRNGFSTINMGYAFRDDRIAVEVLNRSGAPSPFCMVIRGTVRDRHKL